MTAKLAATPTSLVSSGFPTSTLLADTVPAFVLLAIIALAYGWDAPKIIIYGDIGFSNTTVSANGDTARQACFILLFLAASVAGIANRGLGFVRSIPIALWPILAWSWLSLSWAIDAPVAFRRVTFTTIIVLSVSYVVKLLPTSRVLQLLLTAYAAVLLVDWIAVLLFPLAKHQPGELDSSLVGNWRGIHNHKNEAGALCAIGLIFILSETRRVRSWLSGPILVLLTATFLFETHSKTSSGFVLIALLVGGAADFAYHHPAWRRAAAFGCTGGALVALAIIGNPWSTLAPMFDDPAALTGRVQIWPVLLNYAWDHPWLGSGYGSFWAIGDASPIYSYTSGWITTVDHSHNGYIQILIQTGLTGLAIAIITLVLLPFRQLFVAPLSAETPRFLIAAILSFGCLHDLLETSFLDRAASTWVTMLIMYCLLEKGLVQVPTVGVTRNELS